MDRKEELEIVENFISELTKNYKRDIYYTYREYGWTPERIFKSYCIPKDSDALKPTLSGDIADLIKIKNGELRYGCQQYCIVFSDRVFKFNCNEVAEAVNELADWINDFCPLIAEYKYEATYLGVHIYSQEILSFK